MNRSVEIGDRALHLVIRVLVSGKTYRLASIAEITECHVAECATLVSGACDSCPKTILCQSDSS